MIDWSIARWVSKSQNSGESTEMYSVESELSELVAMQEM